MDIPIWTSLYGHPYMDIPIYQTDQSGKRVAGMKTLVNLVDIMICISATNVFE